MGHLGTDKVFDLVRKRFYWPRMYIEIEHYVSHQCTCLKSRRPNQTIRAPLQTVSTSAPMELVSIDFIHLERSTGGYEYILVVVDYFTRFAQAYPCQNKAGRTAATKLFNDFFLCFGFANKILHDQGREFENEMFHELERLTGMKRLRTTPYHAMGNGKTERFSQTLLSMLRNLTEHDKLCWKDSVSKITHAYNCTKHESTNYSLFFLLFGRQPHLPIDLLFETDNSDNISRSKYVENWSQSMKEAHRIAQEHNSKSHQHSKYHYDKKVHFTNLDIGDRVLANISNRQFQLFGYFVNLQMSGDIFSTGGSM